MPKRPEEVLLLEWSLETFSFVKADEVKGSTVSFFQFREMYSIILRPMGYSGDCLDPCYTTVELNMQRLKFFSLLSATFHVIS